MSITFTIFLICTGVEAVFDFPTAHADSNSHIIENGTLNFTSFLLFIVMIFIDTVIHLLVEPQLRNYIKNLFRQWKELRALAIENRQRRREQGRENVGSDEMIEMIELGEHSTTEDGNVGTSVCTCAQDTGIVVAI